MMGLTFDKILFLGLLAAIVIGPTRLPDAAAQLAKFIRLLRQSISSAKDSVREAGGPDLDDVDWTRLDPRQYDPRRIIKEALLDIDPTKTMATPAAASTANHPKELPDQTEIQFPDTTGAQRNQSDGDP